MIVGLTIIVTSKPDFARLMVMGLSQALFFQRMAARLHRCLDIDTTFRKEGNVGFLLQKILVATTALA
jgi:hypothetical protein